VKIEEITVSRKVTVKTADYENAEAFVAIKASADSTESAQEVARSLFALADTLLKENGPDRTPFTKSTAKKA
jgi:hypothetical protein